MSLIEERNKWRREFSAGEHPSIHVLDEYRENRDSELWRSTRAVEKICEYALYLESVIREAEVASPEPSWNSQSGYD